MTDELPGDHLDYDWVIDGKVTCAMVVMVERYALIDVGTYDHYELPTCNCGWPIPNEDPEAVDRLWAEHQEFTTFACMAGMG